MAGWVRKGGEGKEGAEVFLLPARGEGGRACLVAQALGIM